MIFQRDELAIRHLEKMLNEAGVKKSDGVIIRECTPLDDAGVEYWFSLFRGYGTSLFNIVIPSVYIGYLPQAMFLINARNVSYEDAVGAIATWLRQDKH